jgi:hypothetical protein
MRDLFYKDFGIPLSVASGLAIFGASLEFEYDNFIIPAMADYLGGNRCAIDIGLANDRSGSIRDKQNLIEIDFFPDLDIENWDSEFGIGLHRYLDPPCFYYRTHHSSCTLFK